MLYWKVQYCIEWSSYQKACGKNEVGEAIKEEIDVLKKSVAWELVLQNNDPNVIRYRCIYKVKYKFDVIDQYIVGIVA